MPAAALISVLSRSLLAGEQDVDSLHARAARTLGRPWRWILPLAERYAAAFGESGVRPRHRDIVVFLRNDEGFSRARAKYGRQIEIAEWLTEPPRMQPAPAARGWDLPAIETVGDLAAWLVVTTDELEWFADLKELGNKLRNSKLRHYHYDIHSKRSGGVRLIEIPKPRIKELQRRILHEILDAVPVHAAAHGFVHGRSIATFAAPHTGKAAVLRLDLEDFFPAFPAARVQALFRTLGYPEPVADRLGGICANAVAREAWKLRPPEIASREWDAARILYGRPHLPQGAPTSPALANLTAYRLDCRLSGLARSSGAVYTRYADDLAFSGGDEFARAVDRFQAHAAAVALEEGFGVNHHKTRIMRQGVRQHVAGVVVNQKVNLRRRDLERLEATLTNCVRFGPEGQNRKAVADFRAHLEGRVGFVQMVNPLQGERMKALLQQIRWDQSAG
uniref:RNA-directed DNA polymerase n=1 Tax=Solibacter usitatus (strain Ellin6076) TaxID=234267 RepID=Q01ST0_SOLUE